VVKQNMGIYGNIFAHVQFTVASLLVNKNTDDNGGPGEGGDMHS